MAHYPGTAVYDQEVSSRTVNIASKEDDHVTYSAFAAARTACPRV